MLQDRRQAKEKRRELQPNPPTMDQVGELFKDAMKEPGYAYELPFGATNRFYALGVYRDANSPACTWTLHRWENESSTLIWTLATNDQRVISQQLASDFKNWNESTKTDIPPANLQTAMPLPTTKLYSAGDLRRTPFSNLMRLISTDRMTGILELNRQEESAAVYFFEGTPVHAELGKTAGDSAILELVGWTHGDYRFKITPATKERSVTKHLDLLMMEGAYLQDQVQELGKKNVSPFTILNQAKPGISEEEFREIAANKAGISRTLQKKFYDLADGKRKINDIADRLQLSRAEWVPLVHNMLKCELLAPPERKYDTTEEVLATIDWSVVANVERSLVRPDTGAYGYPALLYLLEMEYNRSSRYGKPFSFLILEIGIKKPDSAQLTPLPQQAARELVNLITRLKRKPDILGHYQNAGFALLLPETDSLLAKRFASRLIEVLLGGPALEAVAFSVGVAGCPHDSQDLPGLIRACVQSRQKFGF
ncbi:MAG TPA: DUF4388 domain-containing protein [Candidatus Obscuribacterales bacterium]